MRLLQARSSAHRYVTRADGALLVDLWADLVLPITIRTAWQPVVTGENSVKVA